MNNIRAAIKCLRCNWLMTWAEQRRQFGRLVRQGMSPEAKRLQDWIGTVSKVSDPQTVLIDGIKIPLSIRKPARA